MYAERKLWPRSGVDVELSYLAPDGSTRWIERMITLHGPLDDDQRATLAEIAEKTPVTKAVRAGTEIRTTIQQDLSPGDHSPQNRRPQDAAGLTDPSAAVDAQTSAGKHRGTTSRAAAPAGVAGVVRSTDREDP